MRSRSRSRGARQSILRRIQALARVPRLVADHHGHHAAARFGRWSGPVQHWEGQPFGPAYLLGVLANDVVIGAAMNFLPVWGVKKLLEGLRSKVEREGIRTEELDGVFVGFAPGAVPRLYETITGGTWVSCS